MLALLASLVASASAFAELNVSGTWRSIYHCEGGGCAGSDFPAEPTLTQEKGSSVVHQVGTSAVIGSLSGNVLTLEGSESGYSFKSSVTISADCQTWSGPLSDSNGTSGTDTGTRVTGTCEGLAGETKESKEAEEVRKAKEAKEAQEKGGRPTGTSVVCDYEFATSEDTCVASVGDGGPQPPTITPTGSVTFTTTSGGFSSGAKCSLVPTPGSPQVASCSIAYETAFSGLPGITATYSGDARHLASTGHTEFFGAGPSETSTEIPKGPPGQYPNELVLDTNVPATGTTVEVTVQAPNGHPSSGVLALPTPDPSLDSESLATLVGIEKIGEAVNMAGGQNSTTLAELNADIQKALARVGEQLRSADPNARAEGQVLSKQTGQTIEALTKMLQKQAEAQKEILKNATTSAFASAHRKSGRKHVKTIKPLAYLLHRQVAAGKQRISLQLSRSAVRRLAGKRSRVTVLVRIDMLLPSQTIRGGVPRVFLERITLKRSPAHRKH